MKRLGKRFFCIMTVAILATLPQGTSYAADQSVKAVYQMETTSSENGKPEMKLGTYLQESQKTGIIKLANEQETTSKPIPTSQKTGDTNLPLLFAGILVAVGAVLAVVVKKRKKK